MNEMKCHFSLTRDNVSMADLYTIFEGDKDISNDISTAFKIASLSLPKRKPCKPVQVFGPQMNPATAADANVLEEN